MTDDVIGVALTDSDDDDLVDVALNPDGLRKLVEFGYFDEDIKRHDVLGEDKER